MKRILLSVFCAFALIGGVPPLVQAHDLLPPELLQYMDEHPDATMEDIEAFMRETTAGFSSDTQKNAMILKAAENEKMPFWENAWNFVALGVHHILSGADHILFIVSLALVFKNILGLFKMATAFTIAHSVTLILAGTGWFTLSSRIVEPLIALSIAYVAMTTVFLRHKPFFAHSSNTLWMIFFFGLFHGLGFAGLLNDLVIPNNKYLSSLLFFNVGIEAGQMVVLAVAVPIILWMRTQRWHDTAIRAAALSISCLALFWFVQRLL